jgi:hypothetical protein
MRVLLRVLHRHCVQRGCIPRIFFSPLEAQVGVLRRRNFDVCTRGFHTWLHKTTLSLDVLSRRNGAHEYMQTDTQTCARAHSHTHTSTFLSFSFSLFLSLSRSLSHTRTHTSRRGACMAKEGKQRRKRGGASSL